MCVVSMRVSVCWIKKGVCVRSIRGSVCRVNKGECVLRQ